MRLSYALLLAAGVAGSALLASLRGRGRAEPAAFYAFLVLALDGLGQIVSPMGWPIAPLMGLLVASVAVAEDLRTALSVAALATLLGAADLIHAPGQWRPTAAIGAGFFALVLALHGALRGEKRRLSVTLAELARLRHGVDQLDNVEHPKNVLTLRQVSEEGRRSRQLDRAVELDEALSRLVGVARAAVGANALLYFEVDRARDVAFVRCFAGPKEISGDCVMSLEEDPIGFVLDRQQPFYATDFKKLLWSLPYYLRETKIGSLLAVPVSAGMGVTGVLVADLIETQGFTGNEPALLVAFAELVSGAISTSRGSLGREELGVEFKAIYPISEMIATYKDLANVTRCLLSAARDLVPLEAAAVVMTDEQQTRYIVEDALGWATAFARREVALSERTWAQWVVRSREEPILLDDMAGEEKRMPILVLDEGANRSESLLAVPFKAPHRTLGALLVMGRRGSFNAAAQRVLGILSNQAAGAISTILLMDKIRDSALRDGLTGLYNRRAFGDNLSATLAREKRQGGRCALLMLDIDHFKRLNDRFGHPAGDEVLKNSAKVLARQLRGGDQAARYGGEEFVVVLPGTEEAGAVHLAERIRSALEKSQLTLEGTRIGVTASLGVAVWDGDAAPEALVAAADRALYAAKQGGRNQVRVASPEEAKAGGEATS